MVKKNKISILLILITISLGYGQSYSFLNQLKETDPDSIAFAQIKTDTIFNSNQIISLLILEKNFFNKFSIDFGYSQSELITTSSFAKSKNALAGINGGFFNMDSGGGVTYFEINDTVISRKRNPKLKYGIEDSIMNGAIIMSDSNLILQPAHSEQFYDSSKQETAVLITGPLLLLNSEKMKIPYMKFSNNRHPRTCLCINEESIAFITIDGRQRNAEGMNLNEVQEFLLNIGCVDAVNLDGGGSTTMWTQDKGIVNFPSDKSGERPVANAILILKVDN